MSSPTPIVAPPAVLEYLLYGTFGMLCLAITIGIIILMRRHATRDQMTGMDEIDYPKIAAQLQKEIVRLQELRDRIYPEGSADLAIAEVRKVAHNEPGVESVQGASAGSLSGQDLKAIPAVQELLSAEIESLKIKHRAELSAAQVAVVPVANRVAEEELATLRAEIESLKSRSVTAAGPDNEGIAKLEGEIKNLKEHLQEYEIFEEDLSRVKELSRENTELRNRLAAGGGGVAIAGDPMTVAAAAATLAASIAEAVQSPIETVSSNANLTTGSTEDAQGKFDEGAMEIAIESGALSKIVSAGESEDTNVDQVASEFGKLLASGGAAKAPKGFETKKVSEGPSAELGSVPEDDLMAEFEKLLGSSEKET